jgi:hypothetical protein
MPIIDKSNIERKLQEEQLSNSRSAAVAAVAAQQGEANLKRTERENRAVKRMDDKAKFMESIKAAAKDMSNRVATREQQQDVKGFFGEDQIKGNGSGGYRADNTEADRHREAFNKAAADIKAAGTNATTITTGKTKDKKNATSPPAGNAPAPVSPTPTAASATPPITQTGGDQSVVGNQARSNNEPQPQSATQAQQAAAQSATSAEGNVNQVTINTNGGATPNLSTEAKSGEDIAAEYRGQVQMGGGKERELLASQFTKAFDNESDFLASEAGQQFISQAYDEMADNELYGQELKAGFAQGMLDKISGIYKDKNTINVQSTSNVTGGGQTFGTNSFEEQRKKELNQSNALGARLANSGNNDPRKGAQAMTLADGTTIDLDGSGQRIVGQGALNVNKIREIAASGKMTKELSDEVSASLQELEAAGIRTGKDGFITFKAGMAISPQVKAALQRLSNAVNSTTPEYATGSMDAAARRGSQKPLMKQVMDDAAKTYVK